MFYIDEVLHQMATILIVDDSASMRQMVSFTLSSEGYKVIDASDGKIGLQQAQETAVDLVITDVNMPNMDGISFIKEMRELPNYKYTPLLLLTTESDASKKSEGKAAGATGWMLKPFRPDQLIATVKKVLG